MWKSRMIGASLFTALWVVPLAAQVAPVTEAPATRPAEAPQPSAANKVIAVTVYQGTALVTREVEVKEGKELIELVVNPLPPQTIDSSLYTESSDGIRVLTTRYRTRAVKEDTRAEVRAREEQIKHISAKDQELQKQLEVIGQDGQLLAKLENFTAATMQQLTEKGQLNADSAMKLAAYIMERRSADSMSMVKIQQEMQANQEQIAFLQRQLSELAAGANRTEREAVIVVDKANAAGGKVKLNYLVSAATWTPQYKLRAGQEKDPVQVEYLAAIEQQTGEDWNGVDLVLSTAQPRLNAAPPELLALDIGVSRPPLGSAGVGGGGMAAAPNQMESYVRARGLRAEAQKQLAKNNTEAAGGILNSAAASEQFAELLAKEDTSSSQSGNIKDGPSVAYHLETKFTVPSRNDQQLVEVARIELEPTYFYKAVPVLSPHVYRLAEVTNKTPYVLLPGEATMYVGSDFVGRMTLPLVAIGERFTAGFGVDPQIQAERVLVAKNHSIQGGNQVQSYDYRIRVSSYKSAEVKMQVWDRLPRAEAEAVAVELVKTTPALSDDPDYQRTERPQNLLRWDLIVKPGATGNNAVTIDYQFRLQYDKTVAIGNFMSTKR